MTETEFHIGPMRVMAPTMQLRWVDKRTGLTNAAGEIYSVRIDKELQQMWHCYNTGDTEWRPIPDAAP